MWLAGGADSSHQFRCKARATHQMLYFAYGSNLSMRRMRQRIPSARPLGPALLRGHRLAFHKVGRDGSGKCDAALSQRREDRLHGALYWFAPRHKAALDEYEGPGYTARQVVVTRRDGTRHTAYLYSATQVDATLHPFAWYLEHVVRGACEHRLPRRYLAELLATQVIADTNTARHAAELAIYR